MACVITIDGETETDNNCTSARLNVSESVLGLNSENNLVIYPNPSSSGIFHFSQKIEAISIYQSNGSIILFNRHQRNRLE